MFEPLLVVLSLILYAWLQQFFLTCILPDEFDTLKKSQSKPSDDSALT